MVRSSLNSFLWTSLYYYHSLCHQFQNGYGFIWFGRSHNWDLYRFVRYDFWLIQGIFRLVRNKFRYIYSQNSRHHAELLKFPINVSFWSNFKPVKISQRFNFLQTEYDYRKFLKASRIHRSMNHSMQCNLREIFDCQIYLHQIPLFL